MSPELINTIGTIAGVIVAALGAFLFAFWIAMGIWTFHDIRQRTRDWLVIILAVALVLIFPLIGLILYMMIRPKATLAEVYDRALEEEALLRELEQTAACHSCGVPVKEAWVYCPNCHNQLQHSCPACGNLVRNEWEICVFCGSAQQRAAPQISVAPTFVQGQATLQGTSKAQLPGQNMTAQGLPPAAVSTSMATQTMPAQTMPAQTAPGQPMPDQPATTSRSFRSPFRREAGAPPPVTPASTPASAPASAPAATPAGTSPATPPIPPASDIDDTPYRPARLPE
jgi:RNA polymerase subunit RPABC4/transcription elongation factor Spt4